MTDLNTTDVGFSVEVHSNGDSIPLPPPPERRRPTARVGDILFEPDN